MAHRQIIIPVVETTEPKSSAHGPNLDRPIKEHRCGVVKFTSLLFTASVFHYIFN